MKTLQSKIMRQAYYSYVLSYTEQPMLFVGLILGGSIALFGRWTHVSSIADNLLATPVGRVPDFMASSFMTAIERGELGTVLIVLMIASLTAVTAYRLSRVKFTQRLQIA